MDESNGENGGSLVPVPKRSMIPRRRKHAALRNAMLAAVTPEDIFEIVKLQVFLARKGDLLAAREVLDRVIGRSASVVELMELESRTAGVPPKGITQEFLEAEARAMLQSIPVVMPESAPDSSPQSVEA